MQNNEVASSMEKTKKSGKTIQTVLIVSLFLILGITIGILLFLKWEDQKRKPVYQYVSLSEEAAARAYIWLDRIEDMPLDYSQIKDLMGEIRLTVVLTPGKADKRYTQALAEGTYAECQKQAQDGLERAYREVVRYRLTAAGAEGELTDEALDQLMSEAYGVSVAEYLERCGIQLIPGSEELAERYSGEVEYE